MRDLAVEFELRQKGVKMYLLIFHTPPPKTIPYRLVRFFYHDTQTTRWMEMMVQLAYWLVRGMYPNHFRSAGGLLCK